MHLPCTIKSLLSTLSTLLLHQVKAQIQSFDSTDSYPRKLRWIDNPPNPDPVEIKGNEGMDSEEGNKLLILIILIIVAVLAFVFYAYCDCSFRKLCCGKKAEQPSEELAI